MQERIKLIRKELNMNQKEFANLLGVGQSTLAMMEVSKRDVSDRHIKTICAICNVNENWLRTGEGEMFSEDDNFLLSQLSKQYGLDTLDQKILEIYIGLPEIQRGVIKGFVRSLVDAVLSDEGYEDYREAYIKEKAAPMAARHGDIDGLQEVADIYDKNAKENDPE